MQTSKSGKAWISFPGRYISRACWRAG